VKNEPIANSQQPIARTATDCATVEGQYQRTASLEARIAIHERCSVNKVGLPRWLFVQMDLPAEARILEVGCGVGGFWSTNRELIPPGWQITLTDRSPAMVEEAARRIGGHEQFTTATADVMALPCADASFDAVLAHFMLYHVPDLPRAFAEIRRVLRPRGSFFAATNGLRHMGEAREFAAQAGLIAPDTVDAGDAAAFSLENGASLLAPWFAESTLRRYDDALLITECEPLLAYIQSIWQMQTEVARLGQDEGARRTTALRTLLDERLAADGVIRITKDSGVFSARRD
jgi:SAM-dependent methyltransferase